MSTRDLREATAADDYVRLRAEAERLAGGNADTARRAEHYRQIYRHSRGGHVFPLIAAHGALWGTRYFARGSRVGRVLGRIGRGGGAARIAGLEMFIDRFRAINRRVFVETWTMYFFTLQHGDSAYAAAVLPPHLVTALNACHAANRAGAPPDEARIAALYEAFFRWEQDAIVGAGVDEAVAEFEWRWFRDLALRPVITFAYIPPWQWFRFSNMADKDERIRLGLKAFAIAAEQGFQRVDEALDRYGVLAVDGRAKARGWWRRAFGLCPCRASGARPA